MYYLAQFLRWIGILIVVAIVLLMLLAVLEFFLISPLGFICGILTIVAIGFLGFGLECLSKWVKKTIEAGKK